MAKVRGTRSSSQKGTAAHQHVQYAQPMML